MKLFSVVKKKKFDVHTQYIVVGKKKGRGIRFGAVQLSMKPNTGLQHSLYYNNKGFGCLRLLMYFKCQLCARKSGAYRTVFLKIIQTAKLLNSGYAAFSHCVWSGGDRGQFHFKGELI